MIDSLDALEEISLLVDVRKEHINKYLNIIEKELRDYQEIREIAKRYNWDDITSEVFNVKTDKKYRDLFNSAIINIQEDYRKARALEIIKRKVVLVDVLVESENANDYNEFVSKSIDRHLTQGEYDLLKEVLLWDI